MTGTSNFNRITIQIRRAGRTALGMSYACTNTDISIPAWKDLQLWTDQAIERWFSSLSPSQRSVLPDLQLSLKISAAYPHSSTQE